VSDLTLEPIAPALPRLSLDEAYQYVRPSYDMMLRRIDVAEARARASLTFVGTLMLAAPAFVAATLGAGNRSFASPWFIMGAIAFVCVIICLVAQQVPRVVGEIQVIAPSQLVDNGYLESEPTEFKLNLLLWAATDWEINLRHINRLMAIATLAAVLLSIQVAIFAVWVLHG
jgi:hypothetical protein